MTSAPCRKATLRRLEMVLAELTLADLHEHPVVPADEDAVTRLIFDDLQRPVYESVKSWTVAGLREYVLDDRNDGAELL